MNSIPPSIHPDSRVETDPHSFRQWWCSRRELFNGVSSGLASIALGALLSGETLATSKSKQQFQYPARAKNIIYIHLVGAPSQLDLYVDKPLLKKHHGQLAPKEFIEGKRFAFLRGHPKLLGSPFKFERHGESGMPFSKLLPHLGRHADSIARIETLHTEEFNHAPAQLFHQTGFAQFGRPSLGSWISYGLGTENTDLPAFVVLLTGGTAGAGNSMWGSGFLPTSHQGVRFRSKGDPVLFLSNPKGVKRDDRKRLVEDIGKLNQHRFDRVQDPEIMTRIRQYELAFKMQKALPELMDIGQESPATHQLYGTQPGKEHFANNCLLARRLVESGVRFVQVCDSGWDHHSNLKNGIQNKAKLIDRPIAALLKDLMQRGLLDDTLVVCGAEFGRTPMLQGELKNNAGRDHHKEAFTTWLAGGGVRGGTVFGKTDDMGYYPTENKTHTNDLHATILHLLGVDHEELTYRYQGRDFRLTDVGGRVIDEIIA